MSILNDILRHMQCLFQTHTMVYKIQRICQNFLLIRKSNFILNQTKKEKRKRNYCWIGRHAMPFQLGWVCYDRRDINTRWTEARSPFVSGEVRRARVASHIFLLPSQGLVENKSINLMATMSLSNHSRLAPLSSASLTSSKPKSKFKSLALSHTTSRFRSPRLHLRNPTPGFPCILGSSSSHITTHSRFVPLLATRDSASSVSLFSQDYYYYYFFSFQYIYQFDFEFAMFFFWL